MVKAWSEQTLTSISRFNQVVSSSCQGRQGESILMYARVCT